MADLPGWPYWKVISITGQSGAGTDYQVKLTIGDSAGGDFHLKGHCTNFPQDIRITDDDGTTLLDHWVEDLTADPIVVHVKVNDDLGSNQEIRVYYGKSGETSASNGANTFTQWHGTASAVFLDSLIISGSFVYEAKAKKTSDDGNIKFGLANTTNRSDDNLEIILHTVANGKVYLSSRNEGSETYISEAPTAETNVWHMLKIINTGSLATAYVDDNQITAGGISTNLPNENMGLYMLESAGSGEQEWSFTRKYNSPEPTFSSAGAEQTSGLVPVFIRHNPALTGGMV